MYALSAQILKERGEFRDVMELGHDSLAMFKPGFAGRELRLDAAYQAVLPEFHKRKNALTNADLPGAFRLLYATRDSQGY